jgi:hypothetical protein
MKEWLLTPRSDTWDRSGDLYQLDWSDLAGLSPFILADGSRKARQQTAVHLCCTSQLLYVHFDCQDRDIWGNYTRRDDPLYNEEAVEIFIAPTAAHNRLFQFESALTVFSLTHASTIRMVEITRI